MVSRAPSVGLHAGGEADANANRLFDLEEPFFT